MRPRDPEVVHSPAGRGHNNAAAALVLGSASRVQPALAERELLLCVSLAKSRGIRATISRYMAAALS